MKPFDLLGAPLDRVTLIEASAGTGKTFTITFLYARLLIEAGLRPEQILVVTFTTAAAAELKDRIRARLAQVLEVFRRIDAGQPVAGKGEIDLIREMAARLGPGEPMTLAIRRLADGVHNFDLAAIHTIHGFCSRVLADFAFAGGGRFDVEMVTDDGDLLAECFDDYWRAHAPTWSSLLTAAIYRAKLSPDALYAQYGRIVRRLRGEGEAFLIWPPVLEPATVTDDLLRPLLEQWRAERQAILDNLEAIKWNKGGAEYYLGARPWAATLDRYAADPAGHPPPLNELDRLRGSDVEQARNKQRKNWREPAPHPFFAACEELCATLEAACHGLVRDLLCFVVREFGSRKKARGLRSHDDLLLDLRDGLAAGNGLARLVRRRLCAALIDEFQDTDPLQFEIFERLFRQDACPLFLIGDPKQAIYKFRGADVFSYLRIRGGEGVRLATLDVNHRSDLALVTAVNTLLSLPARQGENGFLIKDIVFEPVSAVKGRAEGRFADDLAPLNIFTFATQNKRNEALRLNALACATEIARLLALGRVGRASIAGAPLHGGQICVLVRRHAEGELVRQALSSQGIDALITSGDSVLASVEAGELHLLVAALLDPGDQVALRSGLATSLMGYSAADIAALEEDEERWEAISLDCHQLSEIWTRRGFAPMVAALMERWGLSARLGSLPGGRRRLANLGHLLDLLCKDEHDLQLGPAELLRHLGRRRQNPVADEESELRLEGDEDLVSIMTIHKSKGLEFPVVFCPFAWDTQFLKIRDEPAAFHDREGRPRLDLGGPAIGEHRLLALREDFAEEARLLYVALTRARSRCYLSWGRVLSGKQELSILSPLALLLHPGCLGESDLREGLKKLGRALEEDAYMAPLLALAQEEATIAVRPLVVSHAPDVPCAEVSGTFRARIFSSGLKLGGRLRSFTSLSRDLHGSVEIPDYDTLAQSQPSVPGADSTIFSFPRGARAGTCLHAILEQLDFKENSEKVKHDLVAEQLRRAGFGADWAPVLVNTIGDVLATPLDPDLPGLRLGAIARQDRLDELEFHYRVPAMEVEALRQMYTHPAGDGGKGEVDFMKGFIDLVFRRQGRYSIVDYKSNHLGDQATDYGQEVLGRAMAASGYGLQALVYALCLHRFLRLRLPDYDYDQHVGAIYYLFLRGMRPEQGPCLGVYRLRPDKEQIEALDARLCGRG